MLSYDEREEIRSLIKSIGRFSFRDRRVAEKIQAIGTKSSDKILEILSYIPQSLTLGQIVASVGGSASRQAYFALLSTLLDSEHVANRDIWALLKRESAAGWTIGDYIAAGPKDAASVQAYLAILTELLSDTEIDNKEILDLLIKRNHSGWTFGTLIARSQDAADYLNFLTSLVERDDVSNSDISILLRSQNSQGRTFGAFITRNQEDSSIGAYVNLCWDLHNHSARNPFYGLPSLTFDKLFLTTRVSFYYALVQYGKIETLYDLLTNNKLSPAAIKGIAKKRKQALLDYIIALPPAERALALRQIHDKDESNQLSAVFETSRGIRAVSIHRGIRLQAEQAYQQHCFNDDKSLHTTARDLLFFGPCPDAKPAADFVAPHCLLTPSKK